MIVGSVELVRENFFQKVFFELMQRSMSVAFTILAIIVQKRLLHEVDWDNTNSITTGVKKEK